MHFVMIFSNDPTGTGLVKVVLQINVVLNYVLMYLSK